MNEDLQANTPAFFTLDGFDGALAKRMLPVIHDALQDNTEAWTTLVANEPNLRERLQSQGLETPEQFDSIRWDQATLLFTSGMAVTNEQLPLQIGERLTRERFGRFPHQDGSALGYFLEHIRPNRSITDNDGEDMYDNIVSLIDQKSVPSPPKSPVGKVSKSSTKFLVKQIWLLSFTLMTRWLCEPCWIRCGSPPQKRLPAPPQNSCSNNIESLFFVGARWRVINAARPANQIVIPVALASTT